MILVSYMVHREVGDCGELNVYVYTVIVVNYMDREVIVVSYMVDREGIDYCELSHVLLELMMYSNQL